MRHVLAVIAFVLLLRLPFLHQAVQGDDVNYLSAAEHAQIDPGHPTHFRFIFQGDEVSMQGHPHPPLNAWFLGALLAVFKDINEVRYHAAYILFSLIAGLAALSLTRRFSERPLQAALLALSVPAFVVNGNSLESDVPLLAWWLAATALYIKAVDGASLRWLAAAAVCMVPAAMTGFQSVVLAPILALYIWRERPGWLPGWIALAMIPLVLGGWQLFERQTSDKLPAQVLVGYFSQYGLQTLGNKARNALALTAHFGWMSLLGLLRARWWALLPFAAAMLLDAHPLFSIPLTAGILMLVWCIRQRDDFLVGWTLLFFGAALVLFFAGSARYLLPLAVPVAILLVRQCGQRGWVWGAIGFNLAAGLLLAIVNYQHWDGYRQLIRLAERDWENKHVWVNGEFGLRYYAEAAGAVPLKRGQAVLPGDIVVSSKLSFPTSFTTGGGMPAAISETTVTSSIPLRLIGLGARSAYSTVSPGSYRTFDFNSSPIDMVTVQTVVERHPVLSFLPMNAPATDWQIVSGLDRVEDGKSRWMGSRAVILLKRPAAPAPVAVELFLPDMAPARVVTITVDGVQQPPQTLPGHGLHTIATPAISARSEEVTLVIEVDKTFSVAGDSRTLGLILVGAGFRSGLR